MKHDTNALVQASWNKIAAIAPQAAELFYANLFNADPSLKLLFKTDMRAQGHKLMQTIGFAVDKLDDLETLVPILQNLGRQHAGYGVRESHYDTVGAALFATLEQGLGADFTPQLAAAWASVYGVMAEAMITAANAASARAA